MKYYLILIGVLLISTALALQSTQNVTVTILPDVFSLKIISPANTVYESRNIPFNTTHLLEIELLEYIDYSSKNPRYRRLCRNCEGYGFTRRRSVSFSEGIHNISIRATDSDGNSAEKNIIFLIDSEKPKIIKTKPRSGLTSGNFKVDFREDNPTSLILIYGNSSIKKTLDIPNDCKLGIKKYSCEVEVNLTEYNGKKIHYRFNLTDILNRTITSKKRHLTVDTSKPIINKFLTTQKKERITFFINLTEKNFDKVKYIDFSEANPRFKNLCLRLSNGICEKRKTFQEGKRNITIEISDLAGNTEKIENIIINV